MRLLRNKKHIKINFTELLNFKVIEDTNTVSLLKYVQEHKVQCWRYNKSPCLGFMIYCSALQIEVYWSSRLIITYEYCEL